MRLHQSLLAYAASSILLASTAPSLEAALVFQAESATYAIDSSGAIKANVDLYLAQTGSTTTLSDGNGLNSIKFEVLPSIGSGSPTLSAILPNESFTGSKSANVAAGSLYEEMPNLMAGVPVQSGRIFLGTFVYQGYSGVNAVTSYTIHDSDTTDSYTASGQSVDGQMTPGGFTISVPEPASLGLMVTFAVTVLRRRRNQFRSRT